MSAEPDFVAATLYWCNDRRAEKDMAPLHKLPKGRRNNPLSCPCGTATGLYVYRSEAVDTTGEVERTLRTTDAVNDFICAFDAGELPQYDEDAA